MFGCSNPIRRSEQFERSVFLPIIDAWVKTDRDWRPRRAPRPSGECSFWKEIAADADTCLGTDVPALRRLLRHPNCAAARPNPMSSSSTIICFAPTRRCDTAHTVRSFRPAQRWSSMKRTSSRTWRRSTSAVRSASFASRIWCATANGCPRQSDESADVTRALSRVADHSRTLFQRPRPRSFSEHRHAGAEARARYTADSLIDHFEEGMALAGALDGLEATLAARYRSRRRTADGRKSD